VRQQQEAIDKIVAWFGRRQPQQVFRLFGYAGTGKTTLARHIVDQLGVRALFAAFTGKAAYVLRTKGCDGAHHPQPHLPARRRRSGPSSTSSRAAGRRDRPGRARVLEPGDQGRDGSAATPDFILREDSPLDNAPLLVLDEVSMVGDPIAADLLSFGT
jgi:exodeoxyribonuclease-5